MSSFTQQLSAAIAQQHQAIEALPFAQSLVSGNLGRDDYGYALGQLRHVHQCLEVNFARHPQLSEVAGQVESRLPAIDADLAVLDIQTQQPSVTAREFIKAIDGWSLNAPWALLGCHYVLEGSRMGSLVLAKPLSTALGVPCRPGAGLDYHLEGAAERVGCWRGFKQRVDSTLDADVFPAVLEGCIGGMAGMYDLYESFSPAAALAASA